MPLYKLFFDKNVRDYRMPFDKFFTFLHLSHMQKLLTVLVMTSIVSITPTFAADLPGSATGVTPAVTAAPVDPVMAPELNAAPVAAVAPSMGSSLGEYKTVACSTNPAFSTNSCDQCFVGGSVKVGENINGLFDNWTNNTPNMLIAYKDEQKLPNMAAFGSTWTSEPTDPSKFWKSAPDVTWISMSGTGGRLQSILNPGQKIRFVESELGAKYTLTKTDKKDGELVGLLKYPIVSHMVDTNTAAEGAATTHYECVSYTLSAPVVTPPVTPEPKPVTPPTPGEVTQTQTGPAETLILILAAFFIAFGMMFSLRKRN